ncbi:cupin domain-containing protein [Lapidilactobacillus bayanensis]|uniref:cupin domain-containing protein n=1 Tax=Lapidilactobacillus bayanensis TaxID=2485998 RepID=UPI000F7A92EA|nr:cupin domain-containing protein [Lapidilactobacillus bayanensis]
MSYDFSDRGGQPVIENIKYLTLANDNYRTTIWTGVKMQVALMTIVPGDDTGLEIHVGIDQFIHVISGQGFCEMGQSEDNLTISQAIGEDDAILIPTNIWHNIKNTGTKNLKLYTIYAEPDHLDGTVHRTHDDARHDPNEQ